jgi:hypothetical protein
LIHHLGRGTFIALIIWFVVAANRYFVAPAAIRNFGSFGETMLLWIIAAIVGFGGTFYYLMDRVPNPPLEAGRFGVFTLVLKALFDLGLASSLQAHRGPTTAGLMNSQEYWLEMAILVVCAYLAGQVFVRARRE